MLETHHGIAAWTDETFGPVSSNFRVITRANEELAEALRAIAAGGFDDAMVEAADVIIVLCRPAKVFGLDWEGFGYPHNSARIQFGRLSKYFTEANKVMATLLTEVEASDNSPEAGRLMHMIYFMLSNAFLHRNDAASRVINHKMAINRGRTWQKMGDGTGYHVRAKS